MVDFTQRSRQTKNEDLRVAEEGFVTTRHETANESEPRVSVLPRHGDTEVEVYVPQHTTSDTWVPRKGKRVYYVRLLDDTAIFLGCVADDHDGYDTERRITHPHTDTEILFDEDGSVHVDGTDTSVTLNADGSVDIDVADGKAVTVDGGTNPVVTDVETTTDSDGHVTDVTTVTSDTLLVPE